MEKKFCPWNEQSTNMCFDLCTNFELKLILVVNNWEIWYVNQQWQLPTAVIQRFCSNILLFLAFAGEIHGDHPDEDWMVIPGNCNSDRTATCKGLFHLYVLSSSNAFTTFTQITQITQLPASPVDASSFLNNQRPVPQNDQRPLPQRAPLTHPHLLSNARQETLWWSTVPPLPSPPPPFW